MEKRKFIKPGKIRTRQDFIRMTNPKGRDYIIGIDVGYSSTVGFHEKGAFIFPSYAREIDFGSMQMISDRDIFYRDDDTGTVYLVGYSAQNIIDDEDTNDTEGELFARNRYTSRLFGIICDTAIGLALEHKHDSRRVIIQTGLPTAYMKQDQRLIRNAFSKNRRFSIKRGEGEWKSYEPHIAPADVHVIAQPMGALYSAMTKSDGTYTQNAMRMLKSNVLVMDIGFGTGDFYGIRDRMVECCDSINDIGMHEVLRRVSEKLNEQEGMEVRVPQLQKALERGRAVKFDAETLTSQDVSITEYVNEASNEVMEKAFEKARSITKSFRGYRYLIVAGGTGEAWFDYIAGRLEGMKTLEVMKSNINDGLPFVYSIARGYYMTALASGRAGKDRR